MPYFRLGKLTLLVTFILFASIYCTILILGYFEDPRELPFGVRFPEEGEIILSCSSISSYLGSAFPCLNSRLFAEAETVGLA